MSIIKNILRIIVIHSNRLILHQSFKISLKEAKEIFVCSQREKL